MFGRLPRDLQELLPKGNGLSTHFLSTRAVTGPLFWGWQRPPQNLRVSRHVYQAPRVYTCGVNNFFLQLSLHWYSIPTNSLPQMVYHPKIIINAKNLLMK